MPSVLLATAGYDHKVRLWEASTGNCNSQLAFADSQVNCLDISPNKQYIAAGGNREVVSENGRTRRTFLCDREFLHSFADDWIPSKIALSP